VDLSFSKSRVAAWYTLTAHVLDDGVPVDVVLSDEVIDRYAGSVGGCQLLEFLRSQTVVTLLRCHPCGVTQGARRGSLRAFPQVTRGIRGIGITSYKIHHR
jgi:hypothetical protein